MRTLKIETTAQLANLETTMANDRSTINELMRINQHLGIEEKTASATLASAVANITSFRVRLRNLTDVGHAGYQVRYNSGYQGGGG